MPSVLSILHLALYNPCLQYILCYLRQGSLLRRRAARDMLMFALNVCFVRFVMFGKYNESG
jgi:hypothetical protein